jgi:hypothetical protein
VITKEHQVELCVVGGGLAGMCAAIAAARNGVKTLLMHDRPVLGGNASSEIRVWICGAHGANNRETGLLEEIQLENLYRNTTPNYSIWDTVLYEKVRFQENLTLLLNCSCHDVAMDRNRIASVTGWQLTTQTRHVVSAPLFADCSGDSVLAPLSGAEFRHGREPRSEFGEAAAPETGDGKTMGMTCMMQLREMDSPQTFIPPAWAHHYPTDDLLPNRPHDMAHAPGFVWIELGGNQHAIQDTEEIRDELLKTALGVWDHIKNHGEHHADNWALDWLGFLPGKRESRRYVGDYLLTENDIRSGGHFTDIVAYGGWSIDDHHPDGFDNKTAPWYGSIHPPVTSVYGIPYRSLYSKNIDNLFFAGRNISASHIGMSSTRVMGTCAVLGQAVGSAAAIATRYELSPRGVYDHKMAEVQDCLMNDDCWLPGKQRALDPRCLQATLCASSGDPEVLRNGHERPGEGGSNSWSGAANEWVEYRFQHPEVINQVRLVFDSDLNRKTLNMIANHRRTSPVFSPPATLVKAFRIEIQDSTGAWETVHRAADNHQRLVKIPLSVTALAVKCTIEETHGNERVEVFSFDFS